MWEGLRYTPAGTWPPFEFVDAVGLWLYLPVPLLLVAALWRHAWRAAIWLTVATAPVGLEYGPLFVPHPSAATAPSLRVMTANLLWRNQDAAAFASAVVAEGEPDVIALQELGPEMADLLARTPPFNRYQQFLYPEASAAGMGILTRLPVTALRPAEMGPAGCRCQEVTVITGGDSIRVLNAHPLAPVTLTHLGPLHLPAGFDTAAQAPALEALLERIAATDGPLLVVGDLNTSDRQPFYRRLRAELTDAQREAGWGLGLTFPEGAAAWPISFPLVRIDYVLYRGPGWQTRAVRAGVVAGADHRFVVAELARR